MRLQRLPSLRLAYRVRARPRIAGHGASLSCMAFAAFSRMALTRTQCAPARSFGLWTRRRDACATKRAYFLARFAARARADGTPAPYRAAFNITPAATPFIFLPCLFL